MSKSKSDQLVSNVKRIVEMIKAESISSDTCKDNLFMKAMRRSIH